MELFFFLHDLEGVKKQVGIFMDSSYSLRPGNLVLLAILFQFDWYQLPNKDGYLT